MKIKLKLDKKHESIATEIDGKILKDSTIKINSDNNEFEKIYSCILQGIVNSKDFSDDTEIEFENNFVEMSISDSILLNVLNSYSTQFQTEISSVIEEYKKII